MERPLGIVVTTAFVFALGTLPPVLGLRYAMDETGTGQATIADRHRRPVHTPCEPGEACTERKKERAEERREKTASAAKCASPRAVKSCAECGGGEVCSGAGKGASCCPRE